MKRKEGYLWKRDIGRLNSWKKLWFKIEKSQITFWDKVKKCKTGLILFKNIINITDSINSKRKFTFTIVTKDRKYDLSAFCEEDKEDWIHSLNDNIFPTKKIISLSNCKILCTKYDCGLYQLKCICQEQFSKQNTIICMNNELFIDTEKSLLILKELFENKEKCKYFIQPINIEVNDNSFNIICKPFSSQNIFNMIQSNGKFDPILTITYSAQIISAFEFLHKQNLFYTVLPPHNIHIDKKGRIQIASIDIISLEKDYRVINNNLLYAEYTAPEIITESEFCQMSNWWNLGIIIYEMLNGYPPFYGDTLEEITDKILNEEIIFQSTNINKDAMDLILKLLNKNPKMRIGVNGIQEIKDHPFFASINWDEIKSMSTNSRFFPEPGERNVDFIPMRTIITKE